jgi:hypothetical protein
MENNAPVRIWTVLFLRLIIAGTFIFSAVSKLTDPGLFEIMLINQGICSDRTAASYFARLLIGGELAIGLLYLQPYYIKSILSPLTALILLIFSGQLVYLLATGSQENCGCFGELVKMSPASSLVKNILLLTIVAIVYRNVESRNVRIGVPVLLLIVSFAVTILIAPIHAHNDFLFSRYTYFEGEGNVDLAKGEKVVAVFNAECEHCQAAATEIGILKNEFPAFPQVYTLFFIEGEGSIDTFNAITGTHFPYHIINANEFFSLIGTSPPRVYVLRDGKVEHYFDENIGAQLKELFVR